MAATKLGYKMFSFFNFRAKQKKLWKSYRDLLNKDLIGYPLYDPPYKVEERLLPGYKAEINFDYFMNVRGERIQQFCSWMEEKFDVNLTVDRNGIVKICDWAGIYGGALFETVEDIDSYFYYTQPWSGRYAGSNVIFDIAAFIGEALIIACPKLYWDEFPFTSLDFNLANKLKKERGSGFQRPEVTGFRNPLTGWNPFSSIGGYFLSLVMWETVDHLIDVRIKMKKKRWELEICYPVGAYDNCVSMYKSKDLPPGINPRDNYVI